MTVSFLYFNETGTTLIPVDYDVSFIGTLLMPTTTTMKTIQTDMLWEKNYNQINTESLNNFLHKLQKIRETNEKQWKQIRKQITKWKA